MWRPVIAGIILPPSLCDYNFRPFCFCIVLLCFAPSFYPAVLCFSAMFVGFRSSRLVNVCIHLSLAFIVFQCAIASKSIFVCLG